MTALPPPPPNVAPPVGQTPAEPPRAFAFAGDHTTQASTPPPGRFIAAQTAVVHVAPAYIPPDDANDRVAAPNPAVRPTPHPSTSPAPVQSAPGYFVVPPSSGPMQSMAPAAQPALPSPGYHAAPTYARVANRGYTEPQSAVMVEQSQTTRTKMIASIVGGLVLLAIPVGLWFTRSQSTAELKSGPGNYSSRDYQLVAARAQVKANLDVARYESCIRSSKYTFAAVDSIMLSCVTEADERRSYATWLAEDAAQQYVAATGNPVSPAWQECMVEQIVPDSFGQALRKPTGLGESADRYATDAWAVVGGACAAKR